MEEQNQEQRRDGDGPRRGEEGEVYAIPLDICMLMYVFVEHRGQPGRNCELHKTISAKIK
jgi:hypothetical protein